MTIEKLAQQEFDFVKQVDKNQRINRLKQCGRDALWAGYALVAIAAVSVPIAYVVSILDRYQGPHCSF